VGKKMKAQRKTEEERQLQHFTRILRTLGKELDSKDKGYNSNTSKLKVHTIRKHTRPKTAKISNAKLCES
jgi:hypothetical protein